MAPLAAVIAKLLRAPLWVQVHGVEAWEELSGLYRWSVETAALVTSVSRYTRRRLLEWVGIDPARVKVLPNTSMLDFSRDQSLHTCWSVMAQVEERCS